MARKWNPKEMKRSYTREGIIDLLKKRYNVSLPWELDDALYYAQTVYPDIKKEDFN